MVVERLDGWIVSEMIYYVLMKTLARLTAWMDGRLDVFDVGDVIMTAGSANARLTDAVTQSRSKCTPASVYSVYAVHNCQCRSSRIDAADPARPLPMRNDRRSSSVSGRHSPVSKSGCRIHQRRCSPCHCMGNGNPSAAVPGFCRNRRRSPRSVVKCCAVQLVADVVSFVTVHTRLDRLV